MKRIRRKRMKRDEMYKLMVNTMINWLPDLDNINTLDITVGMDEVLTKMEEAGMVPPTWKDRGLFSNKWEPED
jgi:hypothetical protein